MLACCDISMQKTCCKMKANSSFVNPVIITQGAWRGKRKCHQHERQKANDGSDLRWKMYLGISKLDVDPPWRSQYRPLCSRLRHPAMRTKNHTATRWTVAMAKPGTWRRWMLGRRRPFRFGRCVVAASLRLRSLGGMAEHACGDPPGVCVDGRVKGWSK